MPCHQQKQLRVEKIVSIRTSYDRAISEPVINGPDFEDWTQKISGLLAQSPKRELYEVIANKN